MKIRKAKPSDAEQLSEVVRQTFLEAYSDILSEEEMENINDPEGWNSHEGFRHTIEQEGNFFLVAEVDGEVVGQLLFSWSEEETHDIVDPEKGEVQLRSTYIHPDYWNQGIGTRMFEEGIGKVPDRFETLKVEVFAENSHAKQFYRKLGFEKCGGRKLDREDIEILEQEHPTDILRRDLS